jgi:gamma-glutamylcyclotransferase (GGCT)/AIG2-like uncharacterized protein YtfP
MNPDRLNHADRLNDEAKTLGIAHLDDWGIRFDLFSTGNGCGVTDMVESSQEYVLGILYDVPTRLLPRMDQFEGVRPDGTGNYRRQIVHVRFDGKSVPATTYIGTPAGRERFARRTKEEQRVSAAYFSHLETGAEKFNFPKEYRAYLRAKAGPLRP